MNKKANKKNKGFSLVELIIVIAIMAILAGVLVPQFIKYIGNSRVSSDIQNAQMMADAISAQIAEDAASGTTTTGLAVPTTGYTFGNISAIKDVVASNGAVATKVDSSYHFFYSIDKDAKVVIYAAQGTPSAPGNDTISLVPNVASGSPWDK